MTDLQFVVVFATGPHQHLDFCCMGMLCYVSGCPLPGNPSLSNARDYALKEFEPRNIPIVNRVLLSLPAPNSELDDDILVHVKLAQCVGDKADVIIINLVGLNPIAEVHEHVDCCDKFSGYQSTDDSHDGTLNVMMDTACDLLELCNALV